MGHRKKIRDRHWPGIEVGEIWNPTSKVDKTLRVVPVYLPLIQRLFNVAAKLHVGPTYLTLLCHAKDGLVICSQGEDLFARESGFSGQRARDSWRKRVTALKKIGAIDIKPGTTGAFHYILIMDPVMVLGHLDTLHGGSTGKTPDWREIYEQLIMRVLELECEGM